MTEHIDYQQLISRADITLNKPVHRSESGLPVGNGQMGSLVWTTPTAMRFQVNRVDVFANNRQTNSFSDQSDYCGGCGFIDIDFADVGPDVFPEDNTYQHLAVHDGVLTLKGEGIEASVFAWHADDVIAIRLSDKRDHAEPININLRMLRLPMATIKNQIAVSRFEHDDKHIILHQAFEESASLKVRQPNSPVYRKGSVSRSESDEDTFYCGSALAVTTDGRPYRIKQVHESELRLSLVPGKGDVTILIASAASFDKAEDLADTARNRLNAATERGWTGLLEDNKAWWHDFWTKSYVQLSSENGDAEYVEKHYTYFLYLMGSTSRGMFPPKFNGMLWNTEGDSRMWGAQYWWNNTCFLYRALPAANHIELLDPMFSMYSGMREAGECAARYVWGSRGLFIPETVWFDGPEKLPPEIATEARELLLYKKPWAERSKEYVEYSKSKHEHSCWWNWRSHGYWQAGHQMCKMQESAPGSYITHIFGSMARIAYMYWLRYEYTKNEEWLRRRAYPMIKGIAEFFVNFPNLKKEADGKYHIHNVNNSEGTRGARDAIGCMCGMKGIIPVAIRASEILGVDADMREVWQDRLKNLAPFPKSDDPDAPLRSESDEPAFWVNALNPIDFGNGHISLSPVTFLDLCTLETKETDPALFQTGKESYDRFFSEGVEKAADEMSMHGFNAARQGRIEDVKTIMLNQLRCTVGARDFVDFEMNGRDLAQENRMTLREGTQGLGAQRLGNVTSALQEALCQSIPPAPGKTPVIRLFPAWPKEWDAEFSLLCRGGFLVRSGIKKGEIEFVEIHSQLGGECCLRNPWGEAAVEARSDDGRKEHLTGSLLRVNTQKAERILLAKAAN